MCEVLHRAATYGINAYNYYHSERSLADWSRFVAEGGKMHLIPQVGGGTDAAALVKTLHPLALQRQGEVVDDAWQAGRMDTVKEWCKKVRDLGVLVGVGTHIPEVIAKIEEENWDVDFYAGCVYNRRRTPGEWKKALGGEMMEMPHDIYMAERSRAHVPRPARRPRSPASPSRFSPPGASHRRESNRPSAPPSRASSRTMASTWACFRDSGTRSTSTPRSSTAS